MSNQETRVCELTKRYGDGSEETVYQPQHREYYDFWLFGWWSKWRPYYRHRLLAFDVSHTVIYEKTRKKAQEVIKGVQRTEIEYVNRRNCK